MFPLLLVLYFVGTNAVIEGEERLPSSKICRGEFDCTDPEECIEGYCRQGLKCRWPGRLDYGSVSPKKQLYAIGDKVTYVCQPGYTLSGEKHSFCESKGRWNNSNPRCVAVGCTNPGRPFRGVMNPDKDWYSVGEVVRYQCKENYQILGTAFTQCRQDGSWVDQVPLCVKPPRPTRKPAFGQ